MTHSRLLSLLALSAAACGLLIALCCGIANVGVYFLARRPAVLTDPAQISARMDQIEAEVRDLRGLPDASGANRELLTPGQLREIVNQDFFGSYTPEQAADDLAEYVAFGELKPDTDLYRTLVEMYATGVAGFYDPDTAKLYVVAGNGFGPNEEVSYAHEYMHALQFQRYDLQAMGFTDAGIEADPERAAGLQALFEGEATLLEQQWQAKFFNLGATIDLYKESLYLLDPAFFRTPYVLLQQMMFPYTAGESFVEGLYRTGGWAAVDAAYREPPIDTEMILHPEKYAAREPALVVPDPAAPELGPDWRVSDRGTMGEFGIRLMFSLYLTSSNADRAAAGWGGDRYLVLRNDRTGATLLAWHTGWDTELDANEFADALVEYNYFRFGSVTPYAGFTCWEGAETACIAHRGSAGVWWFYGTDTSGLDKLVEADLGYNGKSPD